jgi:hypothetical protein
MRTLFRRCAEGGGGSRVSGRGGGQPGRRGRDYVGEEPKRQSAALRCAAPGEAESATTPGEGGSAGAPGEGEGRQVGGFVLPVQIVNARMGGTETDAARAALALHILALAMPNVRAVRIVNSSTWERNGGGRSGKSVALRMASRGAKTTTTMTTTMIMTTTRGARTPTLLSPFVDDIAPSTSSQSPRLR